MKGLRNISLMLALVATLSMAETGRRDFDHDGREDRIVFRNGAAVVESFDAESGSWSKADFQLPFPTVELLSRDALRFLDLNGDGFDDLLISDDTRIYIALWSTAVNPQLGWDKGWSQLVRDRKRTGEAGEPPPLEGAKVWTYEGELYVKRGDEQEFTTTLQTLIAFDIPPPKSPDEALACFSLRDGFRIELVAAEPEVVDPVAFAWGADRRLWVVEMRDYPSGIDADGKVGGVVKVLEDRDADGRYEQVTVFLDGLAYPSGIMPWRDGILISAAPDILYVTDTDGDGRGDGQEVILSGFVPGNQQHRVNGFEWGLDGWIYAANGDSGGIVHSPKSGQRVEISGRDLRFRPDTGEVEAVSSQSQFGRRRDDFGNWFGNNNPTWLWHVGLPEQYLRRNPKLAIKSPKRLLANYQDATRVFPTSIAQERPNQPWSLNHVTSACSPCPYRDTLFGVGFDTSVFISEPVHNVVHREVLVTDGAGFRSERADGEESTEFLASSDPWFRPTSLRTGPDGALYIADFYRFVIEHPEWISPEMQARLDLRAGQDRGRIYRVSPVAAGRRKIPDLTRLDSPGLAKALDSPSGWQRDCVQRLLHEGGLDDDAERVLTSFLAPTRAPQVRTQALATLGMFGRLTIPQVISGLADPHPGVRIQALRESEALSPGPGGTGSLFAAVAAAADDSSPAVRLQAAFSLGSFPPEMCEPVLARMVARDGGDEWIRAALMSSLRPGSPLFASLDTHGALPPSPPQSPLTASTPDRAEIIERYGGIDQLEPDADRGRQHFQTHCSSCHRLGGEGTEVGPDLDTVRGKPKAWLLAAILDPGAAVEARFASWRAGLGSGDAIVGIIAAETANNLTFRLPAGTDFPVLREEIVELEPSGLSLMPTGFESVLDRQAMADLLAWIRDAH